MACASCTVLLFVWGVCCMSPCCLLPVACRVPQGIYLVADDTDAADAWVDALSLCQHLVRTRCSAALEEALAPAPARRGKHGR